MDAEITITTKEKIDTNQYQIMVKESFVCTKNLEDVLAMIDEKLRDVFQNNVEILHWHSSKSRVFLIEKITNDNLCKFYVIPIGDRSLSSMQSSIHEVVTGVEHLIKDKERLHNKTQEVRITVNSDGTSIQRLKKTKWLHRLKKNIANDFIYKLLVPLFALLFSLLFQVDFEKAVIAAIASALGFFLWMVVSPGIIQPSFPYEEE
jgi:hypothetical protein